MAWIFLLIASLSEIFWPLGMKLSQVTKFKYPWLSFSILMFAISGICLWFAQKTIPMGTAYAIWTGVGAIGTFVIGIIYFQESSSAIRILSAFLIVAGVIGLRLSGE